MATNTDSNTNSVDIGFAEKFLNNVSKSPLLYPSKLGGKPAWLCFKNLPHSTTLTCQKCDVTLLFLCQIYAPVTLNEESFHRTIYVFCCKNGLCSRSSESFKVYRTIKLESDEDLNTNASEEFICERTENLLRQQSLCNLCGLFADKKCSLCSSVNYCCKIHQESDWKYHKNYCQKQNNNTYKQKANDILFDEYEIVIEQEPNEEEKECFSHEKIMYKDYLGKINGDKISDNEIIKIKETRVDDNFLKFKDRIKREPEQIIRYDLDGVPLWVSKENIPETKDIKDCSCGAKRQFEFQILPQMLNHLGIETTVDSIDWGTLCIYTCSKNCNPEEYIEELIWKQDFSNIDLT